MTIGRYSSTCLNLALTCALALVLAFGHAAAARAERLPIKTYGPAEGLPSTFVQHVTRDSRGFIWISTRDGLSRFDGSRFFTYGVEQGLPTPTINSLLEARDGTCWVGTNGGGVAQMNPGAALSTSAALFRIHPVGTQAATNQINALFEGRDGRIWAGSDGGLFALTKGGQFQQVSLGMRVQTPPVEGIHTIAGDRDGTLWIRGCTRFSKMPPGRSSRSAATGSSTASTAGASPTRSRASKRISRIRGRRRSPSSIAPGAGGCSRTRICAATVQQHQHHRFHIRSIYRKLEVHSKSEAVVKAMRAGII